MKTKVRWGVVLATLSIVVLLTFPFLHYGCGHCCGFVAYVTRTHCCSSGERLSEMRRLWFDLVLYQQDHGALPGRLDELTQGGSGHSLVRFEYSRNGGAFSLRSTAVSPDEVSYWMEDGVVRYLETKDVGSHSPSLK
jgi:hypothetical protein